MFSLLAQFFQKIIDLLGGVLSFVVDILPSSPFSYIDSAPEQITNILQGINYFIPIYNFVSILQAWLVAVAVYYLYSIWARWAKAIQ